MLRIPAEAEKGNRDRLLPTLDVISLKLKDLLHKPGEDIQYVYFPGGGFCSVVTVMKDGSMVGISTFSGYSFNERSILSLAMVDVGVELGAEVTLVWGEEGGGSAKPVVERHVQAEIRAIVSPCPYSEIARTSYAEGWRTGSA